MTSGPKQAGFTIVETLIFLAVSAGILIAALSLVNGSQSKTSFAEGMKDIDQRLTTIINNVANGYYPRIGDISCSVSPVTTESVTVSSGSEARGSAEACTFIGRVAAFNKDADSFTVFSVAGARQYFDGTAKVETDSMEHARPNVLPDAEVIPLKNGIRILDMRWTGATPPPQVTGAVGFFTSFGVKNSGELQSGSLTSNFAGISNTDLTSTPDNVKDRIKAYNWWLAYSSETNPAGGLELCFESGTTNQVGSIKIGGENRSANITQSITTGSTCW